MNLLVGLLATIGGIVVILVTYILLFRRVEFHRIEQQSSAEDENIEFIDLEVVNLELGKALIDLHNIRASINGIDEGIDANIKIELVAEISRVHRIIEGVHNFIEGDTND